MSGNICFHPWSFTVRSCCLFVLFPSPSLTTSRSAFLTVALDLPLNKMAVCEEWRSKKKFKIKIHTNAPPFSGCLAPGFQFSPFVNKEIGSDRDGSLQLPGKKLSGITGSDPISISDKFHLFPSFLQRLFRALVTAFLSVVVVWLTQECLPGHSTFQLRNLIQLQTATLSNSLFKEFNHQTRLGLGTLNSFFVARQLPTPDLKELGGELSHPVVT